MPYADDDWINNVGSLNDPILQVAFSVQQTAANGIGRLAHLIHRPATAPAAEPPPSNATPADTTASLHHECRDLLEFIAIRRRQALQHTNTGNRTLALDPAGDFADECRRLFGRV